MTSLTEKERRTLRIIKHKNDTVSPFSYENETLK